MYLRGLLMKRFCLALALALLSGSAAAKRTLVHSEKEFDAYVDPETVERVGSVARMWVLHDYNERHVYLQWSYWSQRTLGEYDCGVRRAQTLAYSFHAGQMGGGELILNGALPVGLWAPVPPGSVVEKFWKIACGR